MDKPTLKGSGMHAALMQYFTTFDAFFEWGSEHFTGEKSEFEVVYKEYHPNYVSSITAAGTGTTDGLEQVGNGGDKPEKKRNSKPKSRPT